jgi:hypothetical protein
VHDPGTSSLFQIHHRPFAVLLALGQSDRRLLHVLDDDHLRGSRFAIRGPETAACQTLRATFGKVEIAATEAT